MGDVTGKEFILAGMGVSGAVNDEGDYDYSHYDYGLAIRGGYFNRGYNRVNEIVDNMLVYTMDRPEDGGLHLESMAWEGDYGSGALVEIPELGTYIIGVANGASKSDTYEATWGSTQKYTSVSGTHYDWIRKNLDSCTKIPAEVCSVPDVCEDTNFRADGTEIGDIDGDPCANYTRHPHWCGGKYDSDEFYSSVMCCACGGGQTTQPTQPTQQCS